jgi:hypothetical protein
MFEASAARLHIFEYENIDHYNKILYLDTDIIIQGNIMKIFECLIEDKLYAVKENNINTSFNGAFFFDFNKFDLNTPAFNAGVLLFKNSANIRRVFCDINKHIQNFKNVDFIVALIDLDKTPSLREHKNSVNILQNEAVVIAVKEFESWYLADENALNNLLQSTRRMYRRVSA